MSFFQNPFSEDFRGNWVLGDRQQSLTFNCPANSGRGDTVVTSWANGPFNLSGNDADGNSKSVLVIKLCILPFRGWSTISVTVGSGSATTVDAIVTALNSNATFAGYFTASKNVTSGRLEIMSLKPATTMKFYVVNGRAEEVLKFNARAGIAELPTYFARHTMASVYDFDDSANMLIELSPNAGGGSSVVDDALINNAVNAHGESLGYSASTVKEDYELLAGRSGLFKFQKIKLDGSSRITEIIEYHAGASVGMLAKKTTYTYTDANTNPDEIFEVPYTLESGDLISP